MPDESANRLVEALKLMDKLSGRAALALGSSLVMRQEGGTALATFARAMSQGSPLRSVDPAFVGKDFAARRLHQAMMDFNRGNETAVRHEVTGILQHKGVSEHVFEDLQWLVNWCEQNGGQNQDLPVPDEFFSVSRTAKMLLRQLNQGIGAIENALDGRLLAVLLDPGNAPQELIAEFYAALSAVYIAHGGSGIEIKKEDNRLLVEELV